MRKIILKISFILVLISCSNNHKENQRDSLTEELSQRTVTVNKKIPNDSLKYYVYRIKISERDHNAVEFQTLECFPYLWIGISKNAIGHFIYHIGNEFSDNLLIDKDSLINGGYGEPISWSIREFKKLNDNKYYFGLGSDTTSSTYARCIFEIVDLDTLYSIQSTQIYTMIDNEEHLLGEYSGLYVPSYKQHLFYHIKEPNINSPDSRIPIEEINLERYRNHKVSNKSNL